jgi:hypothetical protein
LFVIPPRPPYLRLFDGPACNIIDMWRILGRGTSAGGLVVGYLSPSAGLKFADLLNVLATFSKIPAARLAAEIVNGRLARRRSAQPHRHACGHGLYHPVIMGRLPRE